MSLGIQEAWIVVKCSNITTGLDLFLFTSLPFEDNVLSFQVGKARHVVVPWEWHQISCFRENCNLFYTNKQSPHISLLPTKTIQNPYPLRVHYLLRIIKGPL